MRRAGAVLALVAAAGCAVQMLGQALAGDLANFAFSLAVGLLCLLGALLAAPQRVP